MRVLLTILFTLLTTIAFADSAGCPKYERKSYRHWIDEDRDCQNARHEVLIAESSSTVVFKTEKGCRVVSGSWNDPYSGKTITDASKLDIDHLVPLKEVHESGGHAWDVYRKRDYANDLSDPNTLIAVDRGLNRQKGSGDPAGMATAESGLSGGICESVGGSEAEVGVNSRCQGNSGVARYSWSRD